MSTLTAARLLPAPDVMAARAYAYALIEHRLGARWPDQVAFTFMRDRRGRQRASYDLGNGDHIELVVEGDSAVVWGYDRRCPLASLSGPPRGLLAGLTAPAASLLQDVASQAMTFLLWRESGRWRRGEIDAPACPDPDGSGWLLEPWAAGAESFATYATEAYERRVSARRVQAVIDAVAELGTAPARLIDDV